MKIVRRQEKTQRKLVAVHKQRGSTVDNRPDISIAICIDTTTTTTTTIIAIVIAIADVCVQSSHQLGVGGEKIVVFFFIVVVIVIVAVVIVIAKIRR